MPMRGLTAISGTSTSRGAIHNVSPRRLSPSRRRSMSIAMQIFPGPFMSSWVFFAFGRRSRIISIPRNGSAPRSFLFSKTMPSFEGLLTVLILAAVVVTAFVLVSVLLQGTAVPSLARRLGVGIRDKELREPYPQHG